MMSSVRALVISWLALVSVCSAQPVPKVNSISPEWFQRGAETEVTISGDNLQDLTGIVFSGDPGLSAAVVMRDKEVVSLESSRGGISSGEGGDKNSIRA